MNYSSEHKDPSIEALLGGPEITAGDSRAAFDRYLAKHGHPEPSSRSRHPALVGLSAVLALVALFSFAPTRSLGQRILSMLRVQKVAVVPIDLDALSAASGSHAKPFADLISDRVVVTIKPGKPIPETTLAAAGTEAGIAVTALESLGDPSRILVHDESAFHLELDRDRILAMFEAAGRPDVSVPADVDGATIAVHIPKAVEMAYGDCSGTNPQACIHFTQVPSPVISIPPALNMAGLAEAALEVGGMTAAEAQSFCQTVDWSSTLVIPVPRSRSSSHTVQIAGVSGSLIETTGRRGAEYALIWVKNKRVFSLGGLGTPDRALAAAETLN